MSAQTLLGINGTSIKHPHAAALAAGAKALREQAKPYSFDAGLYEAGIRSPGGKRAYTERKRLLRYADKLEELAGRRKTVTPFDTESV